MQHYEIADWALAGQKLKGVDHSLYFTILLPSMRNIFPAKQNGCISQQGYSALLLCANALVQTDLISSRRAGVSGGGFISP